ncbi:aspartate/glutamate racemase family protein [Pantoea sp. BS_4]|uniref:aspartate/glutamate racemase family protein n=1 Tax=unclassified Pantoea TaxID=2630326 RepID=UPI002B4A2C5E|nr:aspartate/glutamate racemase family protein [Pantoea sp. JZ2]WRH13308.1 glutamate racemase [Pantoea sp. JZ2]
MIAIACLHTAASNICIFDDAASQLPSGDLQLSHLVMPQLLAEAEASGGLTPELHARIGALLASLQPHFDAILMTCSTLGPVAESFTNASSPCVVWRTDSMLAEAVRENPRQTVVLCAAESTLGATRALFHGANGRAEVVLIPGAWQKFKAGDQTGYLACVTEAVEAAWQQGAEQVVLAQTSMAPAAAHFASTRQPLTGPHLALQRCLQHYQ